MPVEPLLDVETASKILGVSARRFFDMYHKEDFPVVRLGKHVRVDPDDLRRYIDGHKTGQAATA